MSACRVSNPASRLSDLFTLWRNREAVHGELAELISNDALTEDFLKDSMTDGIAKLTVVIGYEGLNALAPECETLMCLTLDAVLYASIVKVFAEVNPEIASVAQELFRESKKRANAEMERLRR